MNDGEIDLSGVTFSISGADLVRALLPQMAQALENDSALRQDFIDAIKPALLADLLLYARSNVKTGLT